MSYDNYDRGCLCIFLLARVSDIDRFPSLISLWITTVTKTATFVSAPGSSTITGLNQLMGNGD